MSRHSLIYGLIILAVIAAGCERGTAPEGIEGFTEGEYSGSFEVTYISPYSSYQTIDQQGSVSFLFKDSAFYYTGEVLFSSDYIYPFEISSRGDYKFRNDTLRFFDKVFSENMLKLTPFFTCEYSGSYLYLTRISSTEKMSIVLSKR